MAYLWLCGLAALLAAGVARFAGRRAQIVPWAAIAGLLGGVVRASQPSLFRAENGFGVALVAFGVPATLIGLVVGLIVRGAAPQQAE
jgi:hypothetical protein